MLILPIGDAHISAEDDLERFKYLSKFIVDKKPDVIVFMGDFLTMDALNFFDKDKRKKLEGKRYKKEIDKGNEALDIIFFDLLELQEKLRQQKLKIYKPEIYFLEGNHSFRVKRYLEIDPTFEGLIGIEQDLKLKERNIKFIPYREYLDLNGIAFTHIPFNKCKEISGVNITRKISQVLYTSCVFAHVHSMEYESFKRHGQKDLQQILSVGCYFEKHEDYVHGRITEYWKGLVLLDSFKSGRFDIQTFSLETLKRKYND